MRSIIRLGVDNFRIHGGQIISMIFNHKLTPWCSEVNYFICRGSHRDLVQIRLKSRLIKNHDYVSICPYYCKHPLLGRPTSPATAAGEGSELSDWLSSYYIGIKKEADYSWESGACWIRSVSSSGDRSSPPIYLRFCWPCINS